MASRNPFEVLGLGVRYRISRAEIERAYLQAVGAIHPDLGGLGPTAFEDESDADVTAVLNMARDTLLNPETRASLMLSLLGGSAKEQDKSLPPTFLLEMMEVREQVEAASSSKDLAELAKWKSWAADQRREYEAKVADLFDKVEQTGANNTATLKEIRATLNAWRYIERLIEQLDPAGNAPTL